MPTDLSRLLNPRSICAIGGREAERVVEQCRRMGFAGAVYPVHPSRREVGGLPCFASVDGLPEAPDAAFVGVRRDRTVEVVRALAARRAGGAVCYASGFAESGARGAALQAALAEAAGDMPILGPNCYGFVNYLDGAPLWPDQQGGLRRDRGVAIVSQSSNLAITLTMNLRAVPIAAMVTLGNRARVGTTDALETLLEDGRITAVGLVVETLEDAPALAAAARKARERRIPLVACKLGRSEEGARLTVSHTASLAGSERSAAAFFRRTGIGRVHSLPALLEALKLLHAGGPLDGRDIASLSCSGGEAAARALLPLGDGLLVERMVGDGVAEVIIGVSRDPQVGLVLVVGSGGLLAELAGDRVVLLAPASRGEIEAALSELKAAALVDGFRGRPAGDRAALVDTVLAVQRFALDHAGRLIELDLNPLIVRPAGRGVAAVDALLRLAPKDPPEDPSEDPDGHSTGDPT